MAVFWSDLVFGARLLRKSPVFALSAVLTLALGIGVNTAVFSVINVLLLQPLPVPGSDRLVVIARTSPGSRTLDGISSPDLDEYRDLTDRVFQDIAGYSVGFASLSSRGRQGAWVLVTEVTGDYFPMLGLTPAAGRLPGPGDVRPGVASPLAVLGYGTWHSRFQGDPAVVGRRITIDGYPVTVIGVAPRAFHGTMAFSETEVYLPLTWREGLPELRAQHAIGRLRPGASIEAAQAVMNGVATRLAADRRDEYEGAGLQVIPEPEARPQEDQARWNRPAGIIALLLVALVLGVATVNVANLVLARSIDRQREMALRTALGAGRRRLLRQLFTEAVLLAILGGSAGIMLGAAASAALSWMPLPDDKPARLAFEIDWRVLIYAGALSLATAIVVGIAPALQKSGTSLDQVLRGRARSAGGDGTAGPIRGTLIVAQLAACFVLLVMAGLFSRSLALAQRVDLGFEPAGVLNVGISAAPLRLGEAEERALFDRVLHNVREVAGVERAAFAQLVPLGYVHLETHVESEGQPLARTERPRAGFNMVTSDYFATMGIPLVQGRSFTPRDTAASPRVAVANRRLTDLLWPGQDPIGRRLRLDGPGEPWVEIVGVTATGRYRSFAEEPSPFVYLALDQARARSRYLQIRTSQPPESLISPIEQSIRDVAPDVTLFDAMSMQRALDGGMGFFLPRTVATLAAILGLLALALAVVGVYGVVAHSTGQRRHEMGIRIALGASPTAIGRLVIGTGTRLIVIGVATGLALAFAAAPLVDRFLFGVSGRDPLILAGIAPLLGAVALAACVIPAWRVTRVDPIAALREE